MFLIYRSNFQCRESNLRRNNAAANDQDVRSADFLQLPAELRHERAVSGRQRRDADDVDVAVNSLLGNFVRGAEERADVDVKTLESDQPKLLSMLHWAAVVAQR